MTKPKKKARTDMRTYLHIFQLKFERHLSNRQIALNLNIGRSTVNDILVRFKSLNLPWPLPARNRSRLFIGIVEQVQLA